MRAMGVLWLEKESSAAWAKITIILGAAIIVVCVAPFAAWPAHKTPAAASGGRGA